MCTGQLVTTALFAIFSTDNIRDLSPPLPPVTQWETWARHIRAPRTWLHHIYGYKKKYVHGAEKLLGTPAQPQPQLGADTRKAPAHPHLVCCSASTTHNCLGSLTHTKTPQTWCCQYHFSPWHIPTPRTGSGKEDAVIELSQVRRALGCKWNGSLFFIRYLFSIPYDCFSQHPLV